MREALNQIFIGFEIDKNYCNIANKRISEVVLSEPV